MKSIRLFDHIELFTFYLLFFFIGIIIHYLPSSVSISLLTIVLFISLITKRTYYWLALVLILIETQTFLFSFAHKQTLIPTFNILPGSLRDLYFEEIFIYVLLIKAIYYLNRRHIVFYSKPLRVLFVYFLILFLFSIVIGIDYIKFFATIRNFAGYTLLFSIPILLNSEENFIRFFKLIFPIVFIVFSIQILEIILGKGVSFLINVEQSIKFEEIIIDPEEKLARQLYAYHTFILALIGSFYFLSLGSLSPFRRMYLNIINLIVFLSAFLSATRGYILCIIVGFILYYMVIERKIIRYIKYVIVPLSLFIILYFTVPPIQIQVNKTYERFMSIEDIVSGNLEETSDFGRITERGPRMFQKYKESWLFGWGFSSEFYEYADKHVGHIYVLLNTGLIGYLLFTWFLIYFINRILKYRKHLNTENPYKKALGIFIIGILIYFTLHSTSEATFIYLIGFRGLAFTLLLFFSFSNLIVHQAKVAHINMINKNENTSHMSEDICLTPPT